MRLLIQRHDRWTFEFVRSASNPLPDREPQLTRNRLTSSSHPSDIDNPGPHTRSHTRSQPTSTSRSSTLFARSGLKLRLYQSSTTSQQKAGSHLLSDDYAELPRRRSLGQRISKIFSSPYFREHNNDKANYCNAEPRQFEVQELQAGFWAAELEEPSVMSAWELPAGPSNEAHPLGNNFENCPRPICNKIEDYRDLYQHRGMSSASQTPHPVMRDREYMYTHSSPAYMSSSTSTSQDVSPMQGPRRPVSSQHLPLMTSCNSQPHVYPGSTCPSLSPATSLSISPISPLQYGQPIAEQVSNMNPFPDSLSSMSAIPGAHLSSSVGSPQRTTNYSVDEQLLSPVHTRRGSEATRFGDNISLVSPTNPVAPPYGMTHDTSSQYEAQYVPPNTSAEETYFELMQPPQGFPSPPYEARNDQSFLCEVSFLRTQASPGIQTNAQMRSQRSRPDELVDMHALVRYENEPDEPLPLYSSQSRGGPCTWDTAAANIAQRDEQVDSRGHGEDHSQAGHKNAECGPITTVCSILGLRCGTCGKLFTGRYQIGNRKRHVKQQHTGTPALFECREEQCHLKYKRDDARRKHEWKKHRRADSKPEKRRKEKRIYMPGMTNTR